MCKTIHSWLLVTAALVTVVSSSPLPDNNITGILESAVPEHNDILGLLPDAFDVSHLNESDSNATTPSPMLPVTEVAEDYEIQTVIPDEFYYGSGDDNNSSSDIPEEELETNRTIIIGNVTYVLTQNSSAGEDPSDDYYAEDYIGSEDYTPDYHNEKVVEPDYIEPDYVEPDVVSDYPNEPTDYPDESPVDKVGPNEISDYEYPVDDDYYQEPTGTELPVEMTPPVPVLVEMDPQTAIEMETSENPHNLFQPQDSVSPIVAGMTENIYPEPIDGTVSIVDETFAEKATATETGDPMSEAEPNPTNSQSSSPTLLSNTQHQPPNPNQRIKITSPAFTGSESEPVVTGTEVDFMKDEATPVDLIQPSDESDITIDFDISKDAAYVNGVPFSIRHPSKLFLYINELLQSAKRSSKPQLDFGYDYTYDYPEPNVPSYPQYEDPHYFNDGDYFSGPNYFGGYYERRFDTSSSNPFVNPIERMHEQMFKPLVQRPPYLYQH